MLFSGGKGSFSDPKHIRRARAYLEEARMAVLEHSIAAEHYRAMWQMYSQRVQRLEKLLAEWEGGPAPVEAPKHRAAEPAADASAPATRPWMGPSGVVMPMPGGDMPPDPKPDQRRVA